MSTGEYIFPNSERADEESPAMLRHLESLDRLGRGLDPATDYSTYDSNPSSIDSSRTPRQPRSIAERVSRAYKITKYSAVVGTVATGMYLANQLIHWGNSELDHIAHDLLSLPENLIRDGGKLLNQMGIHIGADTQVSINSVLNNIIPENNMPIIGAQGHTSGELCQTDTISSPIFDSAVKSISSWATKRCASGPANLTAELVLNNGDRKNPGLRMKTYKVPEIVHGKIVEEPRIEAIVNTSDFALQNTNSEFATNPKTGQIEARSSDSLLSHVVQYYLGNSDPQRVAVLYNAETAEFVNVCGAKTFTSTIEGKSPLSYEISQHVDDYVRTMLPLIRSVGKAGQVVAKEIGEAAKHPVKVVYDQPQQVDPLQGVPSRVHHVSLNDVNIRPYPMPNVARELGTSSTDVHLQAGSTSCTFGPKIAKEVKALGNE